MSDARESAASETTTFEREALTWEDLGTASRELAFDVIKSEFIPDVVVAIARGGLLLAGGIAYALGVKSCGAVNAEFYTGVGARLPQPIMLPPLLDEASIVGKKVLLVDDVHLAANGTVDHVPMVRAAPGRA